MPLNLKAAGIRDNLAKLEQVATPAMEDGSMLYNPVEPDHDAVARIVKKLYHAKASPLPVTAEDLKSSAAGFGKKELKDVLRKLNLEELIGTPFEDLMVTKKFSRDEIFLFEESEKFCSYYLVEGRIQHIIYPENGS